MEINLFQKAASAVQHFLHSCWSALWTLFVKLRLVRPRKIVVSHTGLAYTNGIDGVSLNESNGSNSGPPDLDEVLRNFSQKMRAFFGLKTAPPPSGGGGGSAPDPRHARIGVAVVLGVVVLIWGSTGFYIVSEGQQAVITRFGSYQTTIFQAGFNWRMPYPIESHELVYVSQVRSKDIGSDSKQVAATGLHDSAMLTADENIIDVKFTVQYRLNDARAFLFNSEDPEEAVQKAAESTIREVVGGMKMDAALSEERDQIAPQVRKKMQKLLDEYGTGVEVVSINLRQSGVKPPEKVQDAFDDVLNAGQEAERSKNEAQAYANDVVPRASGTASRLKEEADAYKARVVARAEGDAQRFRSVFTEYQKAPQVTRDRMYLEAMQQVYSSVTKVVVESRQGSNLLYLPLDKILQMGNSNGSNGANADANHAPSSNTITITPSANSMPSTPADARSRDAERGRDGR